MRITTRVLAAAAVAATALTLAAGPASAETAFDPGVNDVVGVGSDTTEIYLQRAANSFNAGLTDQDIRLASFDATGSATIDIRPGTTINRPNGSGAGITALLNNPGIDFARSSRAKGPNDGTLDFYAFASDTQKYATATTSTVPDGLTAAQLKDIYTCAPTAIQGLAPKLPQAGSGSRAFFLTSVGLTEASINPATSPNCVAFVQENDPTAVAGNAAALVPYSVGRFATGQGIKLNTTGYAPSRTLYNVVRDGAVVNDFTLRSIFGTAAQGGFLCNNPSLITGAGFQTVANCGVRVFD